MRSGQGKSLNAPLEPAEIEPREDRAKDHAFGPVRAMDDKGDARTRQAKEWRQPSNTPERSLSRLSGGRGLRARSVFLSHRGLLSARLEPPNHFHHPAHKAQRPQDHEEPRRGV